MIDGTTLLKLARGTIESVFGSSPPVIEDTPWLLNPGATFVTLTHHGRLRGCIGTLEAYRSLREDVCQNALAAAFHDPRFPPLENRELADLKVEVSLLSPPQEITFNDEADALQQLQPNIDGVVFKAGQYRSTFLPQVWEQLPAPALFMAHLKRKAGLTEDFWSHQVKLYRYSVNKWKE